MAKNQIGKYVVYHPEFLYFNTFVRENGYEPVNDPWIWAGKEEESLSPYQVCNILLFDMYQTGKERYQWTHFVTEFFEKIGLPHNFPKHVDINGWIRYAKSLDLEGMLEQYLPRVFQAFGKSFDIPKIKVSPVRLNPCASNHFRSILSGSFSLSHVTAGDPAFYDTGRHIIYFPVPETEIVPQKLSLDWTLVHEIMHAAIRPFYGASFQMGEEFVELRANLLNRAFSEVFCDVGAFKVLKWSGSMPKKQQLPVLQDHLHASDLYLEAFVNMNVIGFSRLCELLSPVFKISRELAFLAKESSKLNRLTEKQMRGILTKKYSYKKRVKGMDDGILKARLKKHETTRMRSLMTQIQDLDIHRLLLGATANPKNPKEGTLLKELGRLFDPTLETEWADAGIINSAYP